MDSSSRGSKREVSGKACHGMVISLAASMEFPSFLLRISSAEFGSVYIIIVFWFALLFTFDSSFNVFSNLLVGKFLTGLLPITNLRFTSMDMCDSSVRLISHCLSSLWFFLILGMLTYFFSDICVLYSKVLHYI